MISGNKKPFVLQQRKYEDDDAQRITVSLMRHKHILYTLPTGGGKTVIAVKVALNLYKLLGWKTLFVSHRREIVSQTVDRLREAGATEDEVGVILSQDLRKRPDAPLQVASIQTLLRREFPDVQVCFVDEAHRSVAKSFDEIFTRYELVFGATATPIRGDGQGLRARYSDLVIGPTAKELIAQGYLAEPLVYSVPPDRLADLAGVKIVAGRDGHDFDRRELSKRVNRKELLGDIVDHWKRLAGGRRTVVFCVDLQHARAVTNAFRDAGIEAEYLDAETSNDDRDAMIGRYGRLLRGLTKVVVTCEVLTEGWDAPPVKCAILARPTTSRGLYLQMAGRILRPFEEVRPLVLDHAGNAQFFGRPHDDPSPAWSLDSPNKRLREPNSDVAMTKQCEVCGCENSLSAWTCEACGNVFVEHLPPEVQRGELVALRERQTVCAGFHGGRCHDQEDVPGDAFTTKNFRARHGGPWRCERCAILEDIHDGDGQLVCAGIHGEPCPRTSVTVPANNRTVQDMLDAGGVWRCKTCLGPQRSWTAEDASALIVMLKRNRSRGSKR